MLNKKKPNREEMSVEQFREFQSAFPRAIPKKKWGVPQKSPTMRAEAPEAALQEFANELLELKKYRSLRFPDGFLRWMRVNAPAHIAAIFFGVWGGRPDNTFLVPLEGGYFLAVPMELKTQDKRGRAVGKLHGKQIANAKTEGWWIARSVEEIEKVIADAEAYADKIKTRKG